MPTASSAPTALATPARRPLRVYAFDPSRGKVLGNELSMAVGYRPLAPGPVELSRARDEIAVSTTTSREASTTAPSISTLPSS